MHRPLGKREPRAPLFMEQPPPLTEAERTWAVVAHLALLALWNMVRGALAAGKGESYAYALILRLVP
nr:hypothetical protein [Thermus amyloliquefaciens]